MQFDGADSVAPGKPGPSTAPSVSFGVAVARDLPRPFWPVTAAWVQRASCLLVSSLREHGLLAALIVAYGVYADALPRWLDVRVAASDELYSGLFISLTAVAAAIYVLLYGIHLRLVVRPADYWARLRTALFEGLITLRRLCLVVPVLVLMPAFGAAFTNLKVLIPALNPFAWDAAFAEWDRVLHFGYDPWQLLQPILGYPYVTSLVNAFYNLWFILAYGVFCWQMATLSRPRLRMQYLLTFVLAWALIGNAMATLLSSAGPVYYGRVTGLPDPFAPLVAYLQQAAEVAPVPVLGIQELLWRLYQSQGVAVGGGISAMPSLHVAIAFSFVLLARAIDRRLTIAFAAFAALIMIGSVHLGWHYAIDGYVSIAATWLIWRAVGWVLDRPAIAWLLWGNSVPGKLDLRRG